MRRPDVFRHPLLENTGTAAAGSSMQTRRIRALTHAARQLCASCPLWAECLRGAVTQSEPGGYIAATTLEDRRWIRRRLDIGDDQGDLPDTGAGPHSADHEAVLDAFDALQERRSAGRGTAARATAQGQQHGHTNEVAMTAPAGERITFSLSDPARAIQDAVLAPLVRSALATLEVTEKLAGILVHTPSAGPTPRMLDALRSARLRLVAWRTATGDETPYFPADGGLTASVSLELAASNPLVALRQDIFEPLLRRLAESLRNIEDLTSILVAAPGDTTDGVPHATELAAVRAALRELDFHLEQYRLTSPHREAEAPDPARALGVPQNVAHHPHLRPVSFGAPAGTATPSAPRAVPSLRKAVEQAVASFPGPFTGRDVLLALPPGAYRDAGKSVSNALSSMVKSGRLRRLHRGTYTAASPSSSTASSHS
ncbi:WhiB family transcriptional regulator [Streptomyces sp. NPDC006678]|uniref:type IV toxin-antitoxin system AbiEi family antitoxin domain-containing protein n=1 Tax=Streptomyces sp. NPDC006678 TaxID=3157185 RepID=UPI00340FACA0